MFTQVFAKANFPSKHQFLIHVS